MCDNTIIHDLQNGKGEDMRTQSLALSQLMTASNETKASLKEMREKLDEIPTRNEVRDMIATSLNVHIETCNGARDDNKKPAESNKFKLGAGKLGVEAEGRAGVIITAVIWVTVGFVLYAAIPRVVEWIAAWASRGGTP